MGSKPARVPPHNLEAEASLLGAMLLSRAAIDVAVEVLEPESFYAPNHAHVYAAIVGLHTKGQPADVTTVAGELRRTGLLETVGESTLTDLMGSTPSTTNASAYADIVADLATLRRVIGVAGEMAELAYASPSDVPAAVDAAEQLLFGVTDTGRRSTAVHVGGALPAWLDAMSDAFDNGRPSGVMTGYTHLDEMLLGLQPGQLVILAGRPGMGKSSAAASIAVNAAGAGHPTLLASLEMNQHELHNRLVSSVAQVDLQRIRSLKLTDRDWPRIGNALAELRDLPFEIVDDGRAGVMTLRSHARRMASRYGRPGLVIVDYVQLMTAAGRHQNREGEVAEVARGLKQMAMELGVPVLALAQLNRSLEQRADKRPTLSDLRESGELENAADVVLFVYRDEYYKPNTEDKGVAEIIVAKQRNGPTGTVRLAFLDRYTRFANLARV